MTTKDTLALALEALELASITVDNFTVQAKCQDAITAIKQAQQQPEKTALDFFIEDTQAHCPYCDGTGDVHSIDGEWRGVCSCQQAQQAITPETGNAANPLASAITAGNGQAPYSNCRFRICDLPGQCKGEGKCHHPAVQQAQEPVGYSERWYGSGDDRGWWIVRGGLVKREHVAFLGESVASDEASKIVSALNATHPAPKQAEPIGKQSLQVPNGYKLVPVEPTPEMVNAGRICPMPTDTEWDEDEDYSAVYRAMLAAAPTPPGAA
jgi:hypothetical protein